MNVWMKFLLGNLTKTFLMIFASIIFLFVLFDYALHMYPFSLELVSYYLAHVSKYAATLMPLALLIACIKVLTGLSARHEWTALLAGGLSSKKLSRPFFYAALGITSLLLINNQAILPKALRKIDSFQTYETQKQSNLNTLVLEDGSKLYYQRIFPKQHTLFDVFWVPSQNEVYRMKSLILTGHGVTGYAVDHLIRTDGKLELAETYDHLILSNLPLKSLVSLDLYTPPVARSISALIFSPWNAKVQTHLFYKLLLPLISITVSAALFPICTSYSRTSKTFLIYACALFAFFTFHALMNAAVILGESDTISPFVAIAFPILIPLTYFGGRFLCR